MSVGPPLAIALDAPLFLVTLLLIPAGLYAIHASRARRRRNAIRMPATATLKAVVAAQPSHRRWIPIALLALALALMSVGLTRPEVTKTSPESRSTVELVIDSSGSMGSEDVQPTRMEAVQNAARRFLKGVPKQTRVGLVGYAETPSIVQEPTTDRGVVNRQVDALVPGGSTFTGSALAVALDAVRAEGDPAKNDGVRPPGAIILLSDGKPSPGDEDPLAVATTAKAQRVPIYTVSLGTPDGVVPDGQGGFQPVPPDPQLMQQIAQTSGGESFSVGDAGQLEEIYKSLGTRVATEAEQREITWIFALAAFLALATALGLGVRWRGRVA
ncbi:VWA domain-containing protein [Patulibacter minatonensis]|uniref:VWA domain-containing protein n=1 Tax=Patulibacter minatonensis TaxID=298163 RepID=UPI00047BF74F|nr:VWA domain-containing protein [Patulibacter minatonensis]